MRGVRQRQAPGEQRGERGRVRAPGAVRGGHVVAGDRNLEMLAPVVEMVDGRRAVPADQCQRADTP